MKIKLPNTSQIEISKKSRFAFLTGAGVSVGSGLPTYYGGNGAYDNLSKKPEDILNEHNKRTNPGLIWDEISPVLELGLKASPCISHKVIAKMQEATSDSYVLTQNVDGLHREAYSKNVIELHGKGREVFCTECSKTKPKQYYQLKDIDLSKRSIGDAPACPDCNCKSLVPNVVMFGELLSDLDIGRAHDALGEPFDVIFISGTQMQFPYILMFIEMAKKANPKCTVIDINPDKNYHNPYADFIFKMTSDEFFESIDRQL